MISVLTAALKKSRGRSDVNKRDHVTSHVIRCPSSGLHSQLGHCEVTCSASQTAAVNAVSIIYLQWVPTCLPAWRSHDNADWHDNALRHHLHGRHVRIHSLACRSRTLTFNVQLVHGQSRHLHHCWYIPAPRHAHSQNFVREGGKSWNWGGQYQMEMVDYKARAYLPTAASVPVCVDFNDNIHLAYWLLLVVYSFLLLFSCVCVGTIYVYMLMTF